ncbi:hypothetical protein FE257_011214 [Aspergillus nanangensis]|uniref:DUF7708 domain-containing protein n=1 Tax=Aspergillus nanangensis TaxID=2582783 RepID=A0AAD4CHQ6_ASPNN|nr:hypothetical protein FE257_011214 [Aspergillus nanangensis]
MPSPSTSAVPPTAESYPLAAFEWRKRFEKRSVSSHSLTTILDVEYNELAQSWKRFQDNIAPNDKVDFQLRPQNAQDVLAVVRDIQSGWMSNPRQRLFNRCMTLCEDFVSSVDPHSVLLAALPNSEFNQSLFYGVLQSIIKASANYPKIMEGIMKALIEVNQSITHTNQLPTAGASVTSIAKFYSLTFFLLGELMDWYVRRSICRLLKSLTQDVYVDFRSLIGSIQRSAQDLICLPTDEMDLDDNGDETNGRHSNYDDLRYWEEARLSQLGLQDQKRRQAAHNAITRQLIWEIQRDAKERDRLRDERARRLVQMLDAAAQRLRPVTQQNTGMACLTTTAPQDLGMQDGYLDTQRQSELTVPAFQDISRFQWSEGLKHKYTRIEVQVASKHLQDFFDSDDQVADRESDVDVIVEDSVITSLQQWATNPHSQVLAVGGSPSAAFPSPVALLSACYVSSARRAQLPVISHFCALPTQEKSGMTVFEEALIALAYSLIRQLIDCLPPTPEGHAACNLGADRFKPLDGTLKSWKEVLSLIDVLLYYAPPLLVCVIDGLDMIQDVSTDSHIRSLVRALLSHTRAQPAVGADGNISQSVLLKVLFTVDGRPSSLVETMSENELILSESNQTDQVASTRSTLNPDVGVVMMNA